MKFRAWLTLVALALNIVAPGIVDPATVVNPGGGGAGSAPTTSATSTSGFGKAWYTTTTGPTVGYFTDDTNVQAFVQASPTSINLFNSTDAGRTYTLTRTITGFPADTFGGIRGVLKSTTGVVMFVTAGAGAGTRGFIRTGNVSAAASQWQTVITGLATNSSAFGIAQSSNGTIVITRETSAVAETCRSVNDGISFTCSTIGTGALGQGGSAITSPSSGVFVLAYNNRFWRSSNDGVSFAETLTPAGGVNGIGCLTPLICLGASGGAGAPALQRSTDGGVTWSQVTVFDAASWGNAAGETVPFINFGGGVVVTLRPQTITAQSAGYRSADFGLTWTALPFYPVVPAGNNGRGYQSYRVQAGNAIAFHAADTSNNPVYSPALLPGQTGVVQADSLNSFSTSPIQGAALFNAQTTGAANTAVVVTLPAATGQRYHLYRVEANCSAGTSTITITDGGVTVWSTLTNEIVAATRFRNSFTPAALTGATNSAMVITLASCGVGNTGTLITHADRF